MSKTIVFIHGMFQNPKSWEKWMSYFQGRGYNCIAPAWPYHEGEPSVLRANPSPALGDLELNDIVASIEQTIATLPEKPILIGHSVGGLIVQLLTNRNLSSMGVCVDSVAPNAMLAFDWSFFKNSASIANPLKGNEPFYMTPEGFYASFANTMTEEESNVAYEQFATHDSRNVLRDCMGAPGHVDLDVPHVPLLFIAGEKDEIIPPELNKKNADAYTDDTSITGYIEFTNRAHYICGQPGWEEVAEYTYNWIEENKGNTTGSL